MNNHQPRRLRAAHQSAFTLVELLVVIGIIALLISILLPVMGRAREAANQTKCSANMRSAVQALLIYTGENKGWMPGPFTSGAIWKSSGAQMSVTDTSSDETALQNMDWVSPTFGKTFRWPTNDYQRLRQIYNVQLRCPSYGYTFGSVYPAGSLPYTAGDLDAASYSAVITFHVNVPQSGKNGFPPIVDDIYAPNSGGLEPPAGYAPQISKVGSPAEKVYLVEGARFIAVTGFNATAKGGDVSFNSLRYQRQGGNFMIGGPYQNQQDTPFQLPVSGNAYSSGLSPIAQGHAWRHRGKMNLAFFDGHVEAREPRDSIQVKLYVPRGTRIKTATNTLDPNDKDGQLVD